MGMVAGFPDDEGPVFLLACCALVDAANAAIGEDPLGEVLDVLGRHLDGLLPEVCGRVTAEALVRTFAHHHRSEMPGDAEVLERLGEEGSVDRLQDLVAAGPLSETDVLAVGLGVLRALSERCDSPSVSVLVGQAA